MNRNTLPDINEEAVHSVIGYGRWLIWSNISPGDLTIHCSFVLPILHFTDDLYKEDNEIEFNHRQTRFNPM